ncbi:asparaginase [Ancylobacter sp. MQZ15Z-1]|uniref:Asparaginase n=1 Tax=Ancylobacter mangrovi TaxID=2972472 RepID=A0A9X2PAG6_9HYPH|nr:asparaginase [Ancylobacter mangrovi]MCS0495011.1 asparaginase [Ancylobacter mangrovi]
MTRPRLLVLSLGGTITMTAADPAAGAGITPTLGAADLVAAVPGLGEVAQIEARSPQRLPSASLGLDHVVAVAQEIRAGFAQGFDGAIVIQGTDTLEETAFALDLLLREEQPVVVTGAMRGAQAPGAEGPANLLTAAIVAASAEARGLGALAVLNDEIHAARLVRKAHSALASAFVSDNGGPLGVVAEGRARLLTRVGRIGLPAFAPAAANPNAALPPVALLKMAMGDDGRLLRAVPGLGYAGLVLEGMGAGHVPADLAEDVGTIAAALPVVLASRTLAGPVFERTYGYAGSEIDLIARGLVPAGFLTGPKARLLLTLALASGWDAAAIRAAFAAYG